MILWMQKHRKYLVVTIWISTIAFVGAGFVGWGAYRFGGGNSNTIAKIGNIKVTNRDLQTKYLNIYNYYNKMLGGKLTKEKAKELRLQEIALNQLFNDALLLNYAKDLGIIVSDKEVLKEIANIDAFKVDGVFSESRYNSILANLGTNSYNFKNDIRKSLTTDKLFKALNLPPTSLEEKALFATLYLQDKIKYKILTDKEITLNVTDDELKKFWEANKQKYKSAKKYSLDIVKVNSDSMEVTDDEIKEFYNKKKFMFKGNDGKILSLEKAKDDVKHKVQLKKAKKEILKKYLKLKNKKISPDESITVAKINAKIPMQKIVTARVGDYIRAIETPYGYACVYLKKIIKPKVLDFNKAKNLAKADLLSKKKEKALKALGEEAIKDFKDAKESNFFTRDDPDKLNFLSKTEALEFLNYIFSQQNKKGYYIYTDKVLAYEIVDQKLFDKTLFDKNKDTIIDGVKNLKRREIESELLKKLQKIYTIEKYYSDKG
jgi:peptidyl-prolyl cis-trans isomerase D